MTTMKPEITSQPDQNNITTNIEHTHTQTQKLYENC